MERGPTGELEETIAGGDRVRAFVPHPLPPQPELVLDPALQEALEAAGLALGRLDNASTLLPDKALFLYSYVRKEAVLSSQIEGTQSTLSDLLLFEVDEAPGVPVADVAEVSSYVAALEHGLARLAGGFPLSNRLVREIHARLMQTGRGRDQSPGEFRRTQVWLGGVRGAEARFVPPPASRIEACMAQLEEFLHAGRDHAPALVRAGLVHVQFETIHPFLDGNGRVGRLLIPLLLHHAGVLREPLLYLSLYFKQNRPTYYALLDRVRTKGDWEAWLAFYLEGVRRVSEQAVGTAERVARTLADDRAILAELGRRSGSVLRIHEALSVRPVATLPNLCEATGLTFPTVSSAIALLEERGIVRELTGRRRDRVFAYHRCLAVLSEDTEPL